MDRRSFLASGAAGALSLVACGGGGNSGTNNPPAPIPTPTLLPFATGWTQMPVQDYRNIPEAGAGNFVGVGGFDKYDLSDPDFLARIGVPTFLPPPDPIGQGQQPSCTAWAVGFAAATATIRYSGTNLDTPISPADLFAKILRRTPTACTNGSLITYAMDTLVQEGVTTLAYAPYSDRQCGIPSGAVAFQLDGFSRVAASDAVAIRGSIQMMQPVSFGMLVDSRFQNLSSNNSLYVPSGSGDGHAMSVIGYDDSVQQYKVMNSWGRNWGAAGTWWISYADFARYANDVCIPYRRRSSDNELLAKATSNEASPITAQHMKGRWYGSGTSGSYGAGVEMGWSAPLDINAASISILDNNQATLFTQDFTVRQIARGIRFGARIPDAVAASHVYLRSAIRGVDSSGSSLTLITYTKPYNR